MKNAMVLLGVSLVLVVIACCIDGAFTIWFRWMDKLVPYAQHPVINCGLSMLPTVFLVWGLMLLQMKFE